MHEVSVILSKDSLIYEYSFYKQLCYLGRTESCSFILSGLMSLDFSYCVNCEIEF